MKNILNKIIILTIAVFGMQCADNTLDVKPLDDNFPFQLVMDTDEGADLPDAEDYGLEIKFADYLPDLQLPNAPILLDYTIADLEDDMVGQVSIDKIIYEVEVDDCVFERELEFTDNGDGTGVISISPDTDSGTVPASFEIVFALPGLDNTEGSFSFALSNLQTTSNILLGSPHEFEYEVLDNDASGEWELTFSSEEEFETFKEVFGSLNPELENLSFADITGNVKAEFEFEEMKFEIELIETEEVTTCEDGETETEIENKVIEIESGYDAEDNEIEFEGSHEVVNDDGIVEDELDFIVEGSYEAEDDYLILTFLRVIDENHYESGDELFSNEDGISFTFSK